MNKAEGYALRTGRPVVQPWKTLQLSTSCLHCLLSRPYRWVSISLLAPDQTPQMTWCPQPLKGCCSERHIKRETFGRCIRVKSLTFDMNSKEITFFTGSLESQSIHLILGQIQCLTRDNRIYKRNLKVL